MDAVRRHGDTAKNTDLRQRRKRPIYDNGTAVQSAEGMLWMLCGVTDKPPPGVSLAIFFRHLTTTPLRRRRWRKTPIEDNGTGVQSVEGMLWI